MVFHETVVIIFDFNCSPSQLIATMNTSFLRLLLIAAVLLVASGFQMGTMPASRMMKRMDLDMKKKSVKDLSDAELKGKRVFVRCDLNVPQNKETLEVTDDTRIRGSVETLKYLASKGAKVMAASHLGRPKDGFEKKFSLEPVAPVLSKYLGQEVKLGKYYFLFVFSFHFFFLSYTKEFRIHTTHTISFVFIDLSHITL